MSVINACDRRMQQTQNTMRLETISLEAMLADLTQAKTKRKL